MDFRTKKFPNLAHTGEKNTSRSSCRHEKAARLLPPTSPHASLSRAERSSCYKCSRPPLVLRYHSQYRTVSHHDTDEKDRILTTGNTMTVTDKKYRDMNGFSQQKRYRIFLHTRGRKIPRDPPAATRKRLGFRPRRVPMPPFLERNDLRAINAAGLHYTTVPQPSTYIYPYGITL